MKAHIQPRKLLSKRVRQEIAEDANEYVQERKKQIVHRTMKGFCYVLNRDFGFGPKRLKHLMNEVDNLVTLYMADEAFWEHLDRVVIDELKLGDKFEPEKVDLEGNFIDE